MFCGQTVYESWRFCVGFIHEESLGFLLLGGGAAMVVAQIAVMNMLSPHAVLLVS